MLFVGRAICGYGVRREADCCVVASVMLCLHVEQVRPTRSRRFAGS